MRTWVHRVTGHREPPSPQWILPEVVAPATARPWCSALAAQGAAVGNPYGAGQRHGATHRLRQTRWTPPGRELLRAVE